jgi:hypothetical protein
MYVIILVASMILSHEWLWDNGRQFSAMRCFQKIIAHEVTYMVFHRKETDILMVPVDFKKACQVRRYAGMSHLVGM